VLGDGPPFDATFVSVDIVGATSAASTNPVFDTVIITVYTWSTVTFTGLALIDATNTGLFDTTFTVAVPESTFNALFEFTSFPIAWPLNVTMPSPVTEYVHVSVMFDPPAIVCSPDGTGPASSITVCPAPDPATVAVTLFAVAVPVLFIRSTTVIKSTCSFTVKGDKLIAVVNTAGVWIVTLLLVAALLTTGAPEFPSVPAAAVLKLTTPADKVLYVHVNSADAPPASTGTFAALVNIPTAAGIDATGDAGSTLSAAAVPVFVTLITICITCPTDTVCAGVMNSADSAARLTMFTLPLNAAAAVKVTLFPKLYPIAVALNATVPTPDALYVHSKFIVPSDASGCSPAGVGPFINTALPVPVMAAFLGSTPTAGPVPPLYTDAVTVNHCPVDTVAGTAVIPLICRLAESYMFTLLLITSLVVLNAVSFMSVPHACDENVTLPAVFALYTHVKLTDPPPVIVTPAYAGPLTADTPADASIATGLTFTAVACPLFATFITIVINAPVPTDAGDAVMLPASTAAVCTVTMLLLLAVEFIAPSELWSIPVTFVRSDTVPVPAALYTHVNVALAPPASDATGVGADVNINPPVDPLTMLTGPPVTLSAAVCPLFVTTITRSTGCPTFTIAGVNARLLVSDAAVSILINPDVVSPLLYIIPVLTSAPDACPFNPVSIPTLAPSALYIYVNAADPAAAITSLAGTGPDTRLTSPVPTFTSGSTGAAAVTAVAPLFNTVIITVKFCPTEYTTPPLIAIVELKLGFPNAVTLTDALFDVTAPVGLNAVPPTVPVPAATT
jgi:hypothetical protein